MLALESRTQNAFAGAESIPPNGLKNG